MQNQQHEQQQRQQPHYDFGTGFPRPEVPTMWSPDLERDSCGVALLAHVGGQASHAIVSDALLALGRMAHRGAKGCDNAEDGVGIMIALPDEFFRSGACDDMEWSAAAADGGHQLPSRGSYAVGMMFLSSQDEERRSAQRLVERAIAQEQPAPNTSLSSQQAPPLQLRFLGWRRVPVDAAALGRGPAKHSAPSVWQFFVTPNVTCDDVDTRQATSASTHIGFERSLFSLTKEIERLGRRQATEDGPDTGSPPQGTDLFAPF
jgi:glutamate synthase domain-containing protein 1